MALFVKSKHRGNAREQIQIKAVKDGVLVLPENHYRAVMEVSSINFELKSEDEQDAIIDTYESFLNSVAHPMQILIRTREIDMDKYLYELSQRLDSEPQNIYRKQLTNYDQFIRSLIRNNKILTRRFYIIIPYEGPTKNSFELIKAQLSLTIDIIAKGIGRLGMHAHVLTSLEILELFYGFYCPEQSKIQPLTEQALSLAHASYIQKEA
jgi:hypothetical protein